MSINPAIPSLLDKASPRNTGSLFPHHLSPEALVFIINRIPLPSPSPSSDLCQAHRKSFPLAPLRVLFDLWGSLPQLCRAGFFGGFSFTGDKRWRRSYGGEPEAGAISAASGQSHAAARQDEQGGEGGCSAIKITPLHSSISLHRPTLLSYMSLIVWPPPPPRRIERGKNGVG